MAAEQVCPACGASLRNRPLPSLSGAMAGTAEIEIPTTQSGSSDDLDPSASGSSRMAPDPILDLVARVATLVDHSPLRVREPAAEAGRSVLASSSSGSWPGLASSDGERLPAPLAPRRSWPIALLAAYAVAATLACGWLLWSRRG